MHSLETYDHIKHGAVLVAAMLQGEDISPVVGGTERYLGFGDTKYGYGPACLVDVVGTEYVAEPHVTWFPWVSARNKVVNFKWAMAYLGKDRQILLTVEKAEKDFFEHFAKRGILRKVGYLDNLPLVDEIHFFQYRGGNNEQDN